MVKKDRSDFENKTDKPKMLPEVYRSHLKNQLNPRLLTTIEVLVWLIQVPKQVRIERLAAHFPLPIKFESRRRHIQRFLQLPRAECCATLVSYHQRNNSIKNQIREASLLSN